MIIIYGYTVGYLKIFMLFLNHNRVGGIVCLLINYVDVFYGNGEFCLSFLNENIVNKSILNN